MIKINDLSFCYEKNITVLNNINLEIKDGERIGLIGANGAGKSTLFKALLGLIDVKGQIEVDNIVLDRNNINEIRKKIGYILQDPDNQMFMPSVLEDMIFGPMNYGLSKDEAISNAVNVLKELNLEYLKDKKNYKISGGEKRMAAIATILNMKPEVILLDEPSNDLDPKNRRQLINVLNNLKQTLIIATHDLDLLLEVVDRIIILNNGEVVKDGRIEDILTDVILLEDNHLELPHCLSKIPGRFKNNGK